MHTFRRTLSCLVPLLLAGACGESVTTPSTPQIVPSKVQLTSDAGDFVGAGQGYTYTQANARLNLVAIGNRLDVTVTGDEGWHATFQEPNSQATLKAGTYTGLSRYPFHNAAIGGIDWSGEGRGCNTITGSFTIDSVTYTNGVMTAIDLRFEQHCEGAASALRGTIHWTAADTTTPPGPVAAPASLWQPPAGALAATGSSAYLVSDAGDYIGQGITYSYASPTTPVSVSTSDAGRRLVVSVGGWSGDFVGMTSISQLKVGYYPGVRRYPFGNPVKGMLAWSGQGRGCNTLTGWFVIDRITFNGTTVTGLDLRFEQHCEMGAPALRGAVRYGA